MTLRMQGLGALLFSAVSLLACGQIELSPIPDLPPPGGNCAGDDCSCPSGSHLVEGANECSYCPFGTVNTDPQARSCVSSQIVAGNEHTCVLFDVGRVRCWGSNAWGQLGYGNTEQLGDDEAPSGAGDAQLGGRAIRIAAGGQHTCALLEGGDVRCWGRGTEGRLGLGDEENVGDDELPTDRAIVDLGEPALQIAAGGAHTCALLEGGRIRCWGTNQNGELGNADTESIGDDEPPRLGLDVDLGGEATSVVLGGANGCATLSSGHARCWGILDFRFVEPDGVRSPAEEGDLPLPGQVEQISLGGSSSCALIEGGALRCWGEQSSGELGYPGMSMVDVEDATDVPVGGPVVRVRTSEHHTCALLTKGNVRCWGGVPGYPQFWPEQAEMTPEELGDVDVGGIVADLAVGVVHTCAPLNDGPVRCWGYGAGVENPDGSPSAGWLGYGNTDDVGDDETPASVGDVPYL